jgi:hypothetical protein
VLLYVYLYHADPGNLYLEPGRPLLLIAPLHFGYSYCTALEARLTTEPEAALASVNPFVSGPALQVEVRKNAVHMDLVTSEYFPPIPTGEWYQPLENCVIPEGFNSQTYERCLATARLAMSLEAHHI